MCSPATFLSIIFEHVRPQTSGRPRPNTMIAYTTVIHSKDDDNSQQRHATKTRNSRNRERGAIAVSAVPNKKGKFLLRDVA